VTIKGVPRVPSGARSRARLTARFDGPEAIVIAQAPAGYGKTVAMAQWASATDSDGIWLRIREGNAEPAALVQHLATELLIADLLDVHNPLSWQLTLWRAAQTPGYCYGTDSGC